ncbi:MAG TPA: cysteine desulfurase family protein [Saprospiraceae bacterium]|nr:cysteine desulfurase family protein [Saprospiraceae bacterium]HQW55965.1 cysteine desulfurase family protein [Saprospiraceae bacterium]
MTRIYLDNAASTPLDPRILKEMYECMSDCYGNPSSTHNEGRKSKALIETARKQIAGFLHTSPGEIYFTSGGTESNNIAIKGAVNDLGVRRIITTRVEHHCVARSISSLQQHTEIECVYIENNSEGEISLEELEDALAASNVKSLVTIMHANNEIGTLNDIVAIGELCKKYDAYFHSDTVQTVGHLPIDLSQTHIHFISGAAHKIHGPKGTGILYINHASPIKALINGGSQEKNLRGGTENVCGILGMARAIQYAYDEMTERQTYITELKTYFKERLTTLGDDIEFNGNTGNNSLYTVLNVSFPPHPKNEMALINLDIHGISASGGSACTSGAEKGSDVINALKKDPERKAVRFSFSHFNTKEELDKTMEVLREIYN